MEPLSSGIATGCLETVVEALSRCTETGINPLCCRMEPGMVTGEEALPCGMETDMEPLSCCIEPVLDASSITCCPMDTGVEALSSCTGVGMDPLLCSLGTGCHLVDWSPDLALASLRGLFLSLLSFPVETTLVETTLFSLFCGMDTTLCPCALLCTAQ